MHPFIFLNMTNDFLEHLSARGCSAAPARTRVDRQNEETITVVDGVELREPLIKHFSRWCIAEFVERKVVKTVRVVGQLDDGVRLASRICEAPAVREVIILIAG